MAVKLVASGLTAGIAGHFEIKIPTASAADTLSDPQLLFQHLAYNSLQEGVSIGVRTTLGHESFKGALKDGFINVGVSSISAFIANKIGQGRLE